MKTILITIILIAFLQSCTSFDLSDNAEYDKTITKPLVVQAKMHILLSKTDAAAGALPVEEVRPVSPMYAKNDIVYLNKNYYVIDSIAK